MADAIQISGPDQKAFTDALAALQDAARRGIVDPKEGVIPMQARLLLQDDIYPNTPPKKVSTGNKRVKRALMGLSRPVSQAWFNESPRAKRLKKIVRENDLATWNIISKRFPSKQLRNSQARNFSPHYYKRGASRPKYNVVLLGPGAKPFSALVRKRQGNVGKAKAAWVKSMRKLKANRAIPSWVSRHGEQEGAYVDLLRGPNPEIRIGNQSSWAQYSHIPGKSPEQIVRKAIQVRTGKMQKYLDRQMDLQARKGARAASKLLKVAKGLR